MRLWLCVLQSLIQSKEMVLRFLVLAYQRNGSIRNKRSMQGIVLKISMKLIFIARMIDISAWLKGRRNFNSSIQRTTSERLKSRRKLEIAKAGKPQIKTNMSNVEEINYILN